MAYIDTVTPIPDEVSNVDAAAIMCAVREPSTLELLSAIVVLNLFTQGLTVHSALRQANLSVNEWVVILGAGGGLGHLG